MAADSRGKDLLAKLVKPILAVGAIALVGGLVWVAVRRVEDPPAPLSLQEDPRSSALAGQGTPPSPTFAVLGDDYAQGEGAGWAEGWVLRLSDQMCWVLS